MKKSIGIITLSLAMMAGALLFTGCNNQSVEINTSPEIKALFWSDSDAISQLDSSLNRLKNRNNLNDKLQVSLKKEGSDTEYVEGHDFPYTMILSMTDEDKNSKYLFISPDKSFPPEKTARYSFSQKFEDQSCAWPDFHWTGITQASVTWYAYIEDAKDNKSKVFSVDLTFTNVE